MMKITLPAKAFAELASVVADKLSQMSAAG